MAYGLKYTTGDIVRNGLSYKLNIYRRDYTGDAYEIGDLQALGLEVQGASGGVDQPIVKTLLHFTVADTVDMGTVQGVKHGGWEEFYTPDATLYKVELSRETSVIWTGFITPDSWGEPLAFRGSITVTARDNIGHLADFEFSRQALIANLNSSAATLAQNEGLVSISNLIRAAFAVGGIAMPLDEQWYVTESLPTLECSSDPVEMWLVNIEAFKDLDWYEVVERVLASAGLALRYTDTNTITLTSLRNLHYMGGGSGSRTVNFVNRSGHRTLDPAYKQIVEKLNYDTQEGYEAKWASGDFTETDRGYWKDVSALNGNSEWTQADATKEVMCYGSPSILPVGGDITGEEDKYVLLASRPTELHTQYNTERVAYIDPDNYVWYRKRLSPGTIVSVGFEVAHCYKGDGSVLYDAKLPAGAVRYAILWRKTDGTFLSLQGDTWVSGVSPMTVDIIQRRGYTDGMAEVESAAVSNNFQTPDVAGFLELRIYPYQNLISVAEREEYYDNDWVDAHIRLGNITFDINSEAIPHYFKTTTVYDPAQNYTLKRNVDFGAVPTRFKTVGTILNGFYLNSPSQGYPSIMNCNWSNDSTLLPLSVLNHLQILSLHAKANSVMTGELRDASGNPIRWDCVWNYAGRTFILMSGTWNILTDRVQNAILREFDTYEAAIGSISADYDTELSGGDARLMALQKSVNAAASLAKNAGGSESGGGGTGTVRSVGVSVPSGMTVSGSPVTSSGTIQIGLETGNSIHGHSNKNTLDNISTQDVQHWEVGYQYAHGHNNKTVLDGITSQKVSQWDAGSSLSVAVSNLLSQGFQIGTITINNTNYTVLIPPPIVEISGASTAPKVKVTMGQGNYDEVALPVAGSSQAGIVSAGAQTFAGAKTFGTIHVDRIYIGPSAYLEWDSSAGAVKLVGNFYATGNVAAGD